MKSISISEIVKNASIGGVDKFATFCIAAVIELLHKDDALLSRRDTSFQEDLCFCEHRYKQLQNVPSFVLEHISGKKNVLLEKKYQSIKQHVSWDEDESLETSFARLADILSDRYSFTLTTERKFTEVVSEWICNGKKDLKTYYPFNNLIDAFRLIGRNSKENISLHCDNHKTVIDKFLMAFVGIDVTYYESSYEGLSECGPERYDAGFSLPPFIDIGRSLKTSIDEMIIKNMKEAVSGRFACILPMRFTFQDGRLKELRKQIVDEQRLKAVVKLPAGFVCGTSINTVALLFDEGSKKNEDILMIDLSDQSFRDIKQKSRYGFVFNDASMMLFRDALKGKNSKNCMLVSKETIESQDFLFDPSVYAISDEIKASLELLAQGTVRLEDIASIYRAQASKSDENGSEYFEIGAADINEYGFIREPSKVMVLGEGNKILKNKIVKGDIVFSIKGTIGKVGIVDKTVDNWLINQSFVIIRVNAPGWTPEFVFRQLKSKAVQDYASLNANGSFIKAFPIDKLRGVMLVEPTEHSLEEAKEKHTRQIQILSEIENLRCELDALNY